MRFLAPFGDDLQMWASQARSVEIRLVFTREHERAILPRRGLGLPLSCSCPCLGYLRWVMRCSTKPRNCDATSVTVFRSPCAAAKLNHMSALT